ncbi:hypothetical protein FRC01_012384, partial [Tulasnella sp. 417]
TRISNLPVRVPSTFFAILIQNFGEMSDVSHYASPRIPTHSPSPLPSPTSRLNASCAVWDVKLGESGVFDVSHRYLSPLLHPEDFGIESFVMNRNLLLRGTEDRHAPGFLKFTITSTALFIKYVEAWLSNPEADIYHL